MDIRSAQKLAWAKGWPQVAEELADTAIFLLGLAEMLGADLQEAVEAKFAKNEARVYRRLPNGGADQGCGWFPIARAGAAVMVTPLTGWCRR